MFDPFTTFSETLTHLWYFSSYLVPLFKAPPSSLTVACSESKSISKSTEFLNDGVNDFYNFFLFHNTN